MLFEDTEDGREKLERKIRKCFLEQPVGMTVRVKVENYNGELQPSITVNEAHPLSLKEHGDVLVEEIRRLLR